MGNDSFNSNQALGPSKLEEILLNSMNNVDNASQNATSNWKKDLQTNLSTDEKHFPVEDQGYLLPKPLLRIRSRIKALVDSMKGRCICQNKGGGWMMCPEDAEVGDTIAIFNGVDTPFVIRTSECASDSCARETCFELIGDCYVEDIIKRRGNGSQKEKKELEEAELGEPSGFQLV